MEASPATRSKMSLTKEFKIDMALLEIPVSGCTCFKTTQGGECQPKVLEKCVQVARNEEERTGEMNV